MLEGRDLDVFVKAEYCSPGEVVPLLIPVFGDSEDDARRKMDAALHTPICNAFAKHFGDSLDARVFGAIMERRSRSPGATVTEMEVLSALDPIATAARKFRDVMRRQEKMHEGSVLSVVYPMGRAADVATFRTMLDELCDMRDRLEAEGWQAKTTRGPMPRGGVDEWLTHCFAHAWERCIGSKVSTSKQSLFMQAACELLPLVGVSESKEPEGVIKRRLQRLKRSRVAPLSGVR